MGRIYLSHDAQRDLNSLVSILNLRIIRNNLDIGPVGAQRLTARRYNHR